MEVLISHGESGHACAPHGVEHRSAVLSPHKLAVMDFARTLGTTVRSDVPCCPGPGNEWFAGAPHRGSPPTEHVSDGMVSDARVVARAATMDCASTSESPPQRRVVVRVPTVARPCGGWFPSADAGHCPWCWRAWQLANLTFAG